MIRSRVEADISEGRLLARWLILNVSEIGIIAGAATHCQASPGSPNAMNVKASHRRAEVGSHDKLSRYSAVVAPVILEQMRMRQTLC